VVGFTVGTIETGAKQLEVNVVNKTLPYKDKTDMYLYPSGTVIKRSLFKEVPENTRVPSSEGEFDPYKLNVSTSVTLDKYT